jgi:ribosomal protein S27AE
VTDLDALIRHLREERDAALARAAALGEALERIAEQQQQTLAKLRKHGIVFEAIGADPSNWQHVAFSIYTDLCQVDTIARTALASAAEPDDEKLLYASDVAAEMFGPPAAKPEPGEAGVLLSASAPVGSEAQPQGSEPAAEPEAREDVPTAPLFTELMKFCPRCGKKLSRPEQPAECGGCGWKEEEHDAAQEEKA